MNLPACSEAEEAGSRASETQVRLRRRSKSATLASLMEPLWERTGAEMNDLDIFFQVEERDTYIETMLGRARDSARPLQS